MVRTVLAFLFLCALPLVAQARQYGVRSSGRDYVVHSRRGPVIMHRALPPFKGQHVYEGRANK